MKAFLSIAFRRRNSYRILISIGRILTTGKQNWNGIAPMDVEPIANGLVSI
jgi:hypothetical protein